MELTGMLTKRGNKLKTWRRRYFELQNNNLCYYVYSGGPRKGEYVLDANTTVVENDLRTHGFCLVQQNGRTLYMSADSEVDKDMWMNGLREIITTIQAESVNHRPKRISLSEEAWAESNDASRRKPGHPEIHIRIIEARDLAAKGSTDTHAKIFVDSETYQTKISRKDLNPTWNEVFHFPWGSHLRYARVEVWDNDPMLSARDNFLGVTYIPILSLSCNKTSPRWYKLGKRTSKSHVTGEIKILAYCDISPDVNALRILREIQSIPELNHGNGSHVISSNTWNVLFEDTSPNSPPPPSPHEFIGRFPTQFPPLESETLEDLSLLVSLRPYTEKLLDSQTLYTDGLLLLTNYRLIFVTHQRLAYANEIFDELNGNTNINPEMNQELCCEIPLASIISITMSLQPDPSILGNTSGPFLDALTIKTNDVKSLCFIFHHMETTSNPDLRVGVRNRGSSVQFSPNASIRMPQNKPKIPQRRASKKLFRSPFLRRRTRSVESNFNEVNQRNLPIGHLRRRSIVKSSVGDELSYLEAADSLEGPPCQRMLTRINNRVINRLAEISNYEMIHSDLLSTILHTATASDSNSINREQNSKISVEPDSYTHWIHQLPNPYRNFISRIILDGWNLYDPISEFNRMGIPDAAWRISNINADYEVCSTYPAILVIPASLDDHRIVLAAQFRSRNRLPAFSWRHPINRCCLCRASQPLVGLSQNRSLDDEMLLEAINLSSKVVGQNDDGTPQYDSNIFKGNSQVSAAPLIIVDARPKINAQANQAAGKGYEIGKGYENCHVLFMGIANIHVMRKSIDMLEDFCNNSMLDDTNWMKNVESTGWLHHVSRVLTAAVRIVHCIAFEEYSVLVHCSDGWDRTAQLTSLPMLMMDPFYRTFRGFMILIEKEWFSFGHKFADRLGWTEGGWNDAERSPVFHQFLDCVHQCLLQNPNIFEFNQEMLVFLGKHVLSGWFGNAFANCEFDRTGLWESTISIWTYLDVNKQSYINPHYQPLCTPYWVPNTSVRCLQVWELWFLKWSHSVWDLFWRKKNEDFSDRPDDPSVWMEDNMTQCCCDCQKPFNFIRRRHHCRACGRIFCENCVKQTRIIPNISEKIPVRCCEDCSNQMSLLDDGKDKKSKLSDKENPNFMKNSTLASFFGIKTSSSHEEIVLDNENFSDTSPNDYRNESASTSHLNSPMMYSQLPEGTIRDEPSRSSERDTDTLFGQYINMTESLTKYPNSEQIASVKIDSSAGLADHPHHVARDPKPIDHYLINHQPFINLEYSDSDSDVDNNNDHELGSELPLEEKEKERVAFSSTDPHHLHHQQHQQQDIIPSSSTNKSSNEKNHKTEKLHHSQKKEETKSHSHQRNKTASRSSSSPSTSPSPKSRSRSKSRSKSPQNSRKSRSPSSSPPPRSR